MTASRQIPTAAASRKQVQAALDAAQKALVDARNAVADKSMHPNRVADFVREIERWTYHARAGLEREALAARD
jgi:hypothetical protein